MKLTIYSEVLGGLCGPGDEGFVKLMRAEVDSGLVGLAEHVVDRTGEERQFHEREQARHIRVRYSTIYYGGRPK